MYTAYIYTTVAAILIIIALTFAIFGLIKKFKVRRWFSLTGLVLGGLALMTLALSIPQHQALYQQTKAASGEIAQDYQDSKNSFDNVEVTFGKFGFEPGEYDFVVTNSGVEVTLTNNNAQAVEGTLKIDTAYEREGNEFEIGFSNYLDFKLEAGESETFLVLDDVTDLETAEILAETEFFVNEEGSYSFFEVQPQGGENA